MKYSPAILVMSLILNAVFVSCGADAITEPSNEAAQSEDVLAQLAAVTERLDSIEATNERQHTAVMDALADIANEVSGSPFGAGAGVQLEGAVCWEHDFRLRAGLKSNVSLEGSGEGSLGVDAYGNGGTAEIEARAEQHVEAKPEGGIKLKGTVCAKLFGDVTVSTGPDGVTQLVSASEDFLQAMMSAVPVDRLVSAAQARGMDGQRLGQAMDAFSAFSLSDFSFGSGGAASLINALPLPPELSAFVNDPGSIIAQKATEAATFATDQLCNQSFGGGEFGTMVSDACAYRDQIPSASELLSILDGLDVLPTTLSQVTGQLGAVCTTINSMVPWTVSIPPKTITIGPILTWGPETYTTFPGYSTTLFSNVSDLNC